MQGRPLPPVFPRVCPLLRPNLGTAFGPVSLNVQSKLSQGEVIAEVNLPLRNQPKQILLRARLPEGWKAVSATAGQAKLNVDEKGTADITLLKGKVSVRFQVKKI